ncbi:hypothetical protein KR032_010941 [Drosophila birchii]|nr:hypothetical protein KR032_010941 [Drosophila birchii]
MAAIRILLISQLFTCVLVSVSACLTPVSVKSCVPFVGVSQGINPQIREPKLPPRDNTCCGPHCTYNALTPPGPCNKTVTGLCLLDTHCENNVAFYYREMSQCTVRSLNECRLKKGMARLIPFEMNKKSCVAQNTKGGVNCCCRETCPTQFCKIQTVTKWV